VTFIDVDRQSTRRRASQQNRGGLSAMTTGAGKDFKLKSLSAITKPRFTALDGKFIYK
jgi:hypothetical protein